MDYFELLKGSGGTRKQGGWFSDLLMECRDSAKTEIKEQEELTAELVMQIANSASSAAPDGGSVRISDITREVARETETGDYAAVSRFVRNTLASEGWGVSSFESKVDESKVEEVKNLTMLSDEDLLDYWDYLDDSTKQRDLNTDFIRSELDRVSKELKNRESHSKQESKKVDEQEDDHPSGHIFHGDKVKVLRGGYKGDVGEVVGIMTPEEDPEDMPDGQFDVKLPDGKMIYLGWDDVELVESKVSEDYTRADVESDIRKGVSGVKIITNIRGTGKSFEQAKQIYVDVKAGIDAPLSHRDESKVNELDEPDLERPEKARRGLKRRRPVRPEPKRKRPRRLEPDVDREPEPKEEPREEEPKPEEKPKEELEVPEIGSETDRDDVPPPPEEIKEPEQPVEMRKEYLGRSEDIHYYFVTLEGEGGAIEDLVIADQEGVKKYSASDHDIEVSEENIADFIIDAIRDLKIAQIERSIFMKYVYPKLEQYADEEEMLEEPEEEDEFGKEKKPFGQEEEEERRSRRIAASKIHDNVNEKFITLQEFEEFMEKCDKKSKSPKKESKTLIETQVIDGIGNTFTVDLVHDEKDASPEAVVDISINGRPFSFSGEFAAMWRDEHGGISEEGLEELALDALAMMEEEEYQELLAKNAESVPEEEVDDDRFHMKGRGDVFRHYGEKEEDQPLKDEEPEKEEDDLSAPPIAPATDDVDLSKADVVREPEVDVKKSGPKKYSEEEQLKRREEDHAAIAGHAKYRPKKPIPDQPEGGLGNENKENENVIKGDDVMSKTAKDLLQEAEGLEAQAAELRKEADVLAEKDSTDEGIAPDPKASQEDIIKKLLEEIGITETDVAKGTKALVLLAKEALKAGNYAKLGEYATKLAEIEAMIPVEAESEAAKVDPDKKDDKPADKKDDKPEKKDDKPEDKPEKKDDKEPEKKDDVPEIGDKDDKKEKGTAEKKSPPPCDKCDKAHWPFDKCTESEEVVDEAKKDAEAKAKKEKEDKEKKAKKEKEDKEKKAKKEKAEKDKAKKAKAKKESKIPVEEPDEDLSESKSIASLKNLLDMRD